MTKASQHRTDPPSMSSVESGLVRAAKVIPAMEKPRDILELLAGPHLNRCTGHCGHCEIHPCQLHMTV